MSKKERKSEVSPRDIGVLRHLPRPFPPPLSQPLMYIEDEVACILTREDKFHLELDAVFVEYLLYKVTRWEKAFSTKANRTLRTMAGDVESSKSGLVVSEQRGNEDCAILSVSTRGGPRAVAYTDGEHVGT